MNPITRTAAVLFAAAGLALSAAPLAGAATTAPTTATVAPAHHGGHGPGGHGHFGHHGHWGGYGYNDNCDGQYYYQGYWYDSCGDVLTADPNDN
jgi:hypothetical protein